jgi:hypothetical protein
VGSNPTFPTIFNKTKENKMEVYTMFICVQLLAIGTIAVAEIFSP